MNISPIAIPYAKALFDLAVEQDLLETTLNDMKTVAGLFTSNRDFRIMVKSPVISIDKKVAIFKKIFEPVVSKLSFIFLMVIINKRREVFLPDIAFQFIELYKDYKGILTTEVKTAVPLSDNLKEKLIDVMKEQTKKEIDFVEEVNEELIGGFVLKWKDKQYDASIRSQIVKLQRRLARINPYSKEI